MTRVFVHRAVGASERHQRRPGLCERARIVDRELVDDRVTVETTESFDEMRVCRRAAETRFAKEVGRFDDERCTLPATQLVSGELSELTVGTPVKGNDASVVHHLVLDHDVAWKLKDLHVVVVRPRHHRRSGVETHQAAI